MCSSTVLRLLSRDITSFLDFNQNGNSKTLNPTPVLSVSNSSFRPSPPPPSAMALCHLRLRRAVSLSSSILNHHLHHSSLISPLPSVSATPAVSSIGCTSSSNAIPQFPSQSRLFRASAISLSSRSRSFDRNPGDEEIGPDTILFEGCDYNHWLITIDFPKDPAPTREEMIETYIQTAAKVFGRSSIPSPQSQFTYSMTCL